MSVRDENYTPAQRIYRQAETIRRQQTVIDTLRGDKIAHLIVGVAVGGFAMALVWWQADPLVRLLDDVLTLLGSQGRTQ